MQKLTKKQAKKIINTKLKQGGVTTKEDIKLLNDLNKIKGVTARFLTYQEITKD